MLLLYAMLIMNEVQSYELLQTHLLWFSHFVHSAESFTTNFYPELSNRNCSAAHFVNHSFNSHHAAFVSYDSVSIKQKFPCF